MALRRPTSDPEYRGRTKAAARRCQKKQEEHWAAHGVDDASPLGHTRQKPHGASKVARRVRNVTKTTRRATTGVPKAVNKTPNEARRGRRQAKDSYRLTQRRRSNVDRNGVLEDEDYDNGEEEEEEGEDEEDEEDDDDDGDEEEEDDDEDEDEDEEEESASDNEYVNSDIHIPGDVLAALTPKFDELKKLIRTQDERAQMRSDANAKECVDASHLSAAALC
ncbi:hypothetical protein FALBO_7797 [Fusarium albosuccineum]|uniref:Uncharacterized protein n=1 Tax=Fusarium albosuccineum TaxID=1237068 RepID=A0A8H4LBZ3_9HYPO|nr:hypothetical protein FALBO_7797 [Fusarium albosuccineum]